MNDDKDETMIARSVRCGVQWYFIERVEQNMWISESPTKSLLEKRTNNKSFNAVATFASNFLEGLEEWKARKQTSGVTTKHMVQQPPSARSQ